MKRLKHFQVWILGLTLVLTACSGNSEKVDEFNELFGQVMQVHDEVMPKMGEVQSLSAQLKTIADTTANKATYDAALAQLKEADEDMEAWMMQFADTFIPIKNKVNSMSEQEIDAALADLKAELEEVNQVKASINASIDKATPLVQ